MAINFPDSPTLNQEFTSGTTTWRYDGTKWNMTGFGPVGATGPTGPTGATGPVGPLDSLSDVSAESPTNGHFLKWNGTAWVNDAIDLGTDTTGNYVATIAGTTNQVSVSGSGSESAAVTLSTPQDIHTGATPTFAGAILSGSSSSDLLRITQTGSGNALVVEDSTNPDSTPLVVDTGGRLVVGHTSALVVSGTQQAQVQLHSISTNRDISAIASANWNNTVSGGPQFSLVRARSGAVDVAGAVIEGDQLGRLAFIGNDGTTFKYGAAVTADVDDAVSTGIVPSRLSFQTANSSGTLTERMRIDSAGQVSISGSSSGDLLRITQTGAGNALVVEDSTNPDSTPTIIDASGNIITGHTSALATVTGSGTSANPRVQIHGTNAAATTMSINNWSTTIPALAFSRSTSTTVGTFSAIASGTTVGAINFNGDDGTEFLRAATITGVVDDTVSTGVVPGRLVFFTTNSAGSLTERMRIDSAGAVGIGATPSAGRTLQINKALTGATVYIGISNGGQIQSDVTTAVQNYRSGPTTAAASFTLLSLTHFYTAGIATPGSGSAITNQYGFFVDSALTGATSNFAFYGDIAAASGRYNLYMAGTAANYMAGRLGVGAVLTSGAMAQVTNTTAADKALVVKGAASQSGNLFEIQNSAGTALGAFSSEGRLYVDSSAAYTVSGFGNPVLSIGSTGSYVGMSMSAWYNTSTGAPALRFGKSRSGSQGTFSIVSSGDTLGTFVFGGDDGAKFAAGARISGFVDDTPALDSMPGRLAFFTTASGSTTPTERMRIDSSGRIAVGTTTTSGSMFTIVNTTAADDALIIKGAASQSGYLTEWQNSTGTTVAYVNADGTSSFGGNPLTSSQAAAVLIMDIGA